MKKYLFAGIITILTTYLAVAGEDKAGIEIVLGNTNAPITIIEYTSLTCTHCADFHLHVLPQIREKLINTGQVKLVLKPYAMDPASLSAFKLLQAIPEDKRDLAMSKIFSMQALWIKKPPEELGRILGLSEQDTKAALTNTEKENALISTMFWAQKNLNVNATPTFIYGTESVEGAPTLEEFTAKVESLKKPA